ncbi:GNAT family N-acetyltransferase [Pseudalkalibacillus sp. Hm43]|uniref:GNAT family N-acetyltransferase n=1 Tax=Pseudalkalibacillus sp. Hm43 TaxID=3450742 RepID=UPI003F42D04F
MEFQQLETERLHLVQIKQGHTESFYNILSRDDVIQYYGMDRLTSMDQASKIIDSFQSHFEKKQAIRWGMVHKETEEFIGTLGLNNLSLWSNKSEIGFELHPDYWKMGLTSEAVKAVLDYSFTELELYRLGAVTYPQNEASINLLMNLGFKEEGRLRGYLYQNQQSHDALIFSLLMPEWE